MRSMNPTRIATVLAILAAGLLSGCGNNDSSNGALTTGSTFGYGSLGSGGCVPVTQPFSFQMNGAYYDNYNIVGGQLPYTGSSIGQSGILGVGGSFQGQFVGSNWAYGTVTMALSSASAYNTGYYNSQYGVYSPYSGYPSNAYYNPYSAGGSINPNSVVAQGTIQVGAAMIQQIISDAQSYMYSYPGSYSSGLNQGFFSYPGVQQNALGSGTPCVSQVAVNIGHSGYQLYGGQVFLYMNGTANGYVLKF